jgi:uncharacterized membrane protein
MDWNVIIGAMLVVLGVLIVIAGIIWQPPDRGLDEVPERKWYEKIIDAIIGWINKLIEGDNPKQQLIILGVILMLGGFALAILPEVIGGGDGGGGDGPSEAPSETSSPSESAS